MKLPVLIHRAVASESRAWRELQASRVVRTHHRLTTATSTESKLDREKRTLTVDFRDGAGRRRTNLFEILVNAYLVVNGLRPAFLIQWIDYQDSDRAEVRRRIFEVLDGFPDNTFVFKDIDQGTLVLDGRAIETLSKLVSVYEKTSDDKVLGTILGYPCAGELNDTTGTRLFRHIVTNDGGDVMSNICSSRDSAGRFDEFANTVVRFARDTLGVTVRLQA
ncbi:MAG: hypothetical protein AAF799_30825 [Myxococcota bacterium]